MLWRTEGAPIIAIECEDFFSQAPTRSGTLNFRQLASYRFVGPEECGSPMLTFGEVTMVRQTQMRWQKRRFFP